MSAARKSKTSSFVRDLGKHLEHVISGLLHHSFVGSQHEPALELEESLRKQQIHDLLVEKQCHLIGHTLFILITDSKT